MNRSYLFHSNHQRKSFLSAWKAENNMANKSQKCRNSAGKDGKGNHCRKWVINSVITNDYIVHNVPFKFILKAVRVKLFPSGRSKSIFNSVVIESAF